MSTDLSASNPSWNGHNYYIMRYDSLSIGIRLKYRDFLRFAITTDNEMLLRLLHAHVLHLDLSKFAFHMFGKGFLILFFSFFSFCFFFYFFFQIWQWLVFPFTNSYFVPCFKWKLLLNEHIFLTQEQYRMQGKVLNTS